ncbi:MAG: hypothetical protein HUU35_07050, partial [Armatimonadetes bacterium]|nr:hypothetical protein [Armatimonadota bacterium]
VARWVAESDRPGADLELEQKILWDANALDLHGAMFVVRGLSYAGVQGIPPEVLAAVFGAVEGTHRQWSEAAHFETTRRWLRARAATESEFLRRLAEEL